jgi:CheY-like chemotaxis protein
MMRSAVLVLDDDPLAGEQLRSLISVLGHSAEVCRDPAKAFEMLGERSFDVVFCDFWMPGISGQDFYAEATRRWPNLADRIIFLTGSVLGEETQLFLRSTGNLQLLKPFKLPAVKEVLASVLVGKPGRASAA